MSTKNTFKKMVIVSAIIMAGTSVAVPAKMLPPPPPSYASINVYNASGVGVTWNIPYPRSVVCGGVINNGKACKFVSNNNYAGAAIYIDANNYCTFNFSAYYGISNVVNYGKISCRPQGEAENWQTINIYSVS